MLSQKLKALKACAVLCPFIFLLVPTQCFQELMVDHCMVWHCAGCLQDWVEATLAPSSSDSRPAFLVGSVPCLHLEMQDRPQGRHEILCCLSERGMVSDSSFSFSKVRQAALAIKPGLVCVACGSYRRGKATCGDVDVLVTHPDGQSHRGVFSKLLSSLRRSGKGARKLLLEWPRRGGDEVDGIH